MIEKCRSHRQEQCLSHAYEHKTLLSTWLGEDGFESDFFSKDCASFVSTNATSGFFPRASERRVLLKVGSAYFHIFTSSHLHIFTTSHPHIFTSSRPHIITSSHLHILTSSHLHIFTSSYPHICTSSHLHIHIFTSSHLHIFTSSHPHILTFSLSFSLSLSLSLSFSLSLSLSLLSVLSLPFHSLLLLLSLFRPRAVPTTDHENVNPLARNEVRVSKTEVKLRL